MRFELKFLVNALGWGCMGMRLEGVLLLNVARSGVGLVARIAVSEHMLVFSSMIRILCSRLYWNLCGHLSEVLVSASPSGSARTRGRGSSDASREDAIRPCCSILMKLFVLNALRDLERERPGVGLFALVPYLDRYAHMSMPSIRLSASQLTSVSETLIAAGTGLGMFVLRRRNLFLSGDCNLVAGGLSGLAAGTCGRFSTGCDARTRSSTCLECDSVSTES
jgi:hypothetical protein